MPTRELADKALEQIERAESAERLKIKLDARYTEATALLNSGRCRQALEVWLAVQQIDPAYPDAKIEATASKKLKELAQPAGRKTSIKLGKFEWGIIAICLAALLLGGGVGIYNAFFAPPAQTCTIPKGETAVITSGERRFSVTLDGKFSSEKEWSDATCVDLLMITKGLEDTQLSVPGGMSKTDAQSALPDGPRAEDRPYSNEAFRVTYFWPDSCG